MKQKEKRRLLKESGMTDNNIDIIFSEVKRREFIDARLIDNISINTKGKHREPTRFIR